MTVDGERIDFRINPMNVQALLMTGRTLVRRVDGRPVIVEMQRGAELPRIGPEVQVADLPSLIAAGGMTIGGTQFRLTSRNVRELRERGNTSLRNGEGGEGEELHVTVPTAAASGQAGGVVIPRPQGEATVVYPWDPTRPMPESVEPHLDQLWPLPDFPFAIYLPYIQEWRLVGFARGDLLNTIALSPQEETTIDVFTWDRYKTAAETTIESGWETSVEGGWTVRLTRDVMREVTRNESWKLTNAGINVVTPANMATTSFTSVRNEADLIQRHEPLAVLRVVPSRMTASIQCAT